jgi:hypothetical protein
MKKSCIVLIVLLVGLCTLAQMGSPARAEAGVIKSIACYIPNRVFDLVDIFRVRVRVGPGISAGVRATTLLSGYLGLHDTIYIGLPGPRGETKIPWPVGLDVRGGAQVSLADATAGGPYYDPLEFGFEVQPLIVGVNVGIGGFEILDFLTGLLFIDIADDDFGKDSKKEEPKAGEPSTPAPATET